MGIDLNAGSPLGAFERYLSLWVALAMVSGVGLGLVFPFLFGIMAEMQYGHVHPVIAVFVWVMIYPMMVNVDFSRIGEVWRKPEGFCLTLVVNWLVKPFTMAALAVLFFEHVFAGLVAPESAREYVAGMILLGVAPCTAMVFVWSQLVRGDAGYTLVQVAVNDVIMIFAFAPLAGFLLGVGSIDVPWGTLVSSMGIYVLLPLVAGYVTRLRLNGNHDREGVERLMRKMKPYTVSGLLATVVFLFGFQAQTIVDHPFVIGLIAIPLVIQTYGIFLIAYGWAWLWRIPFPIAAPAALIGTSNFFELAVAVAINVFGFGSGAALATVVGVLVEVPVMLSLVAVANGTRGFFRAGGREKTA